MSAGGRVIRFDDGAAYERFMGRWSRVGCRAFIDWLSPPAAADWLDVGCGTGILAETILDSNRPASVRAFDAAAAQVRIARERLLERPVDFQVADACALPYGQARF